jgi:aminodeoxyfutalosine synthase
MVSLIQRSELADIYEKVYAGTRITDEDALRLYTSRDINAIGAIANVIRERKNGTFAYYILNRHLNYSNICILDCQFCAFAKRKRDAEAYEYSIDEMVDKVGKALAMGITEVHIVGGLHPSLKFEFYTDMLRALKKLDPKLHLKAFTAIEIYHLAWLSKKTMSQVLEALRDAGLDSLPGGGAEIFDAKVRDQICHAKETADEWLAVHRTWHKMGGRSTCTMLYGHVETHAHRIDHMRRLRELQDETKGFTAFIPLPFHPENTELVHLGRTTGFDSLRTLAISRIYLDNFDHIKAYWIVHGLKLAQVALSYGVDDIDGTVLEERIYHMAGSKTPEEQTRETLERTIREAGRVPVQRDSLYNAIRIAEMKDGEGESTVSEAEQGENSPLLDKNLATA